MSKRDLSGILSSVGEHKKHDDLKSSSFSYNHTFKILCNVTLCNVIWILFPSLAFMSQALQ